jgi:hypothetical protein
MDDLERQYLLTAHDLTMADPRRTFFYEDEVDDRMELDYGPNSDEDLISNITSDLYGRGYLEIDMQNHRLGRVALRLTAAGTQEAERLRDPIEQRKELRRSILRAVYERANGSPTEFVYWRDLAPQFGHDDVEMPPSSIMSAIDQLAGSGYIILVVDEGVVYRITPAGINEVENIPPGHDRRGVFVLGSSPHSIIPPPIIESTPDEFSSASSVGEPPVEIQGSLNRFKADHPNPDKVAFIMMQFGQTRAHAEITEAVRDGLAAYGIVAVRADGKRYHDNLFYNVLTYLHGCEMGIAIYERIETQTYNPNVALEVGYLFAMRKPVCLLKDRTLDTLPADLIGQLYDPFDTQDPAGTIPPVVSKWISDKGLA